MVSSNRINECLWATYISSLHLQGEKGSELLWEVISVGLQIYILNNA